jgi:hypothetical protein
MAIGTMKSKKPPILWVCDDPICIANCQKVANMGQKQLDAYERKARRIASEEAGEYLDQIGKTDLAKLTETEWVTFNEKIILGFERAMRDVIASGEAPF